MKYLLMTVTDEDSPCWFSSSIGSPMVPILCADAREVSAALIRLRGASDKDGGAYDWALFELVQHRDVWHAITKEEMLRRSVIYPYNIEKVRIE